MKGLVEHLNLIALVICNVFSIAILFASIKWPRVARAAFFLVFGCAAWVNWKVSQESPSVYSIYSDLAWSSVYRDFINGWFSTHIALTVGTIACCQALIAISMLARRSFYRTGCIGGIIFLLAITPLGVGSGFPCTVILALALGVIFKGKLQIQKPKGRFQKNTTNEISLASLNGN